MSEFLEYIRICLVYMLVPLVIYALFEEFITRTKTGQRFERWIFKKLGIDPDIK